MRRTLAALLVIVCAGCATKKPSPSVPIRPETETAIPPEERFTDSDAAMLEAVHVAAVDEGLSAAVAAAKKKKCGVERWDVKTLTDDDVGSVNFTPKASTVKKLAALPPRCNGGLHDPRSGATEFTVFEIQATVDEVKSEDDRDLHIVLKDQGKSMVAELVDPVCPGTRDGEHVDVLRAVRTAFATKLKSGALNGHRVKVRGVGFFDQAHGQTGAAPSCVELHPVLFMQEVGT